MDTERFSLLGEIRLRCCRGPTSSATDETKPKIHKRLFTSTCRCAGTWHHRVTHQKAWKIARLPCLWSGRLMLLLLLLQTLLLLLTVQVMLMLLVCGGGQGQGVQGRTVVAGAGRPRGGAEGHGLHPGCSLMTPAHSKSEFMVYFSQFVATEIWSCFKI